MINKLCKLWLVLRVYWSNYLHRKDIKNCLVSESCKTLTSLKQFAKTLYQRFEYLYDGPKELFDSMHYPAQCYYDYSNGVLRDDCDGFHAALYHAAQASGWDCYLLTYIPQNLFEGHTVLYFKKDSYEYILNYESFKNVNSLEEYLAPLDVRCYNLIRFDYSRSKYIIYKEK